MGFLSRLFGKQEPMASSTFWQDWNKEQVERIRRGEPIQWLPGTPMNIRVKSELLDRLNAEALKEKTAPH